MPEKNQFCSIDEIERYYFPTSHRQSITLEGMEKPEVIGNKFALDILNKVR